MKIDLPELDGDGPHERVQRRARFLRPRATGRQQRVELVPIGFAVDRLNHQLVVKVVIP